MFLKSGEVNFVVPENIKGSTKKQQRGYEERCKKKKRKKDQMGFGPEWFSLAVSFWLASFSQKSLSVSCAKNSLLLFSCDEKQEVTAASWAKKTTEEDQKKGEETVRTD